jgi:hypothetical protein
MVACDFCPLVFHLDCLDPPLVCMPVGKWMCPNHPQNIVIFCLLKEFFRFSHRNFGFFITRNINCCLIHDLPNEWSFGRSYRDPLTMKL